MGLLICALENMLSVQLKYYKRLKYKEPDKEQYSYMQPIAYNTSSGITILKVYAQYLYSM